MQRILVDARVWNLGFFWFEAKFGERVLDKLLSTDQSCWTKLLALGKGTNSSFWFLIKKIESKYYHNDKKSELRYFYALHSYGLIRM